MTTPDIAPDVTGQNPDPTREASPYLAAVAAVSAAIRSVMDPDNLRLTFNAEIDAYAMAACRAFAEQAAAAIRPTRDVFSVSESAFDQSQADALDWAIDKIRELGGIA